MARTTEVGHHTGTVYREQDGEILTFSSGSKAYYETIQTLTTAGGGKINNYGHTRLVLGSSDVLQLCQPEKGLRKTITCVTSEPLFIRSTAASSTAPAFCIGSTSAPMHSCINVKGSSHTGDHGWTVELLGISSNLWDLITPLRTASSRLDGTIELATAT